MSAHPQTRLIPGDRPVELQRDAADLPLVPLAPLAAPQQAGTRRWSSSALLGEAKEVEIEHEGMVYRLRQTALGKLILTK